MIYFTVICCLAYLAWLVRENRLAHTHRKALRHVIHVNGIRGKSSVCRLIDAGLRANGMRVLTKTTGTCPAVIRVDGVEERLGRRGKPSIKEQLRILGLAAAQKADVLVIECMAIAPDYQRTSEERMLRSDIGVITNVRLDHPDEMGATLDEIAEALSLTIPEGGTLFTADEAYGDFFRRKAGEKGTSFVLSQATGIDYTGIDFTENVSLALAVCERLGVDRETALAGMREYRKDPGAFSIERTIGTRGKQLVFLNALAANDPSSAERILDLVEAQGFMASGKRVLLVNNRHDRPRRTKQFIEFAVKHENRFDRIVAAGSSRSQMCRALVQRGISPGRIVRLGGFSDLAALEDDAVVFAVGNIVGSGRIRSEADRKAGIFDVR